MFFIPTGFLSNIKLVKDIRSCIRINNFRPERNTGGTLAQSKQINYHTKIYLFFNKIHYRIIDHSLNNLNSFKRWYRTYGFHTYDTDQNTDQKNKKNKKN